MDTIDERKVEQVYCRQPNDPPICGDKVRLPNQSDPEEQYEIISFLYKKNEKLKEEDDWFRLRSGDRIEDRQCIEVKSYPRKEEGKRPALKIDRSRISPLEPEIKERLEDFLGKKKFMDLGDGKTVSVWGIMKTIKEAGYDILISGGAVRDFLRGEKEANDADLAGAVPFGAFTKILKDITGRLDLKYHLPLPYHVLSICDPQNPEENLLEYATLKFDYSNSEKRYEFDHDLSRDASRRDITINSLYCDVFENLIFDPMRGRDDLLPLTIRPNQLPREYPKGYAAGILLRLLKSVKKWPMADKTSARNFVGVCRTECEEDFENLKDSHRKRRVVVSKFYGSGMNLCDCDRNELREACIALNIEDIWEKHFKPLWEGC